ncbi:MAG: sigma-54-dependent Fis family transcriptional regulator [Motiliproteus sp.]
MITPPRLKETTDVVAYVTGNFQERNLIPDDMIAKSWQRSLASYGLDPHSKPELDILTATEIGHQLDLHHDYLDIAKHGLTGLYKKISSVGFSVLLADESGVTLDSRLPDRAKNDAISSALVVGARWAEKEHGTNGIGTCLHEKQSLIIHRDEHFLSRNNPLSCSVTPIFDPLGNLKGCLNASCLNSNGTKEQQYLTLQLVMMYGRMIENAYFRQLYRSQITLQVKEVGEFCDLSYEQLLAINERGVIIGGNRSSFAEYEPLLQADQQLLGCQIEDIIGLNVDSLLTQTNGGATAIRQQSPKLLTELEISLRIPTTKFSTRNAPVSTKSTKKHKHPSLDQLCGHDPQIRQNVQQIRHILNKDIPVLITGETGTGKEAFARAIHDASDRANGPFIALNCAAIPESLIESELFGYSSGSFTGANRKGMKGKLQLANEGTIFLDEIGDMPIQLQTRLLRALAEREILPLGAVDPISLDIQIISATHQNLAERIREKLFREDFFYRLNGMSLQLPPLRQRTDKDHIVQCILNNEFGGAEDVKFSPEAQQLINSYHWPGNIRQLSNALRYALAVSDNKNITLNCLPVDIRVGSPIQEEAPFIEQQELSSLSDFVGDEEGRRLLESLRRLKWNITLVSDELGICRSTVYRKMKKYNILQPNEMY